MLKLPKNKFGCFVFWPLAIYMSFGAMQDLSVMRTLDTLGITTIAYVIGHEANSKGKEIPTFKYEVLDAGYTVTTSKLTHCRSNRRNCTEQVFEIGDIVEIRVNTENPKQFIRASGDDTNTKTFAFICMMIFLLAAPWIIRIPEDD